MFLETPKCVDPCWQSQDCGNTLSERYKFRSRRQPMGQKGALSYLQGPLIQPTYVVQVDCVGTISGTGTPVDLLPAFFGSLVQGSLFESGDLSRRLYCNLQCRVFWNMACTVSYRTVPGMTSRLKESEVQEQVGKLDVEPQFWVPDTRTESRPQR